MFLLVLEPGCVRLCKVEQGSDQHRKVIDEPTVEVDKPQESLYVSLIFQDRPFLDFRDLDWIHRHFVL